MHAFDASSMIYAWDNYPIDQFPGLWDWMGREIKGERLVIPDVALGEVEYKTPECGDWLCDCDIVRLAITSAILTDAMRIKRLIGIVDDHYHPKGVDENDILIITVARAGGFDLVSDEDKQPKLSTAVGKMKIPAVCAMKVWALTASTLWNT